MAMKALPPLAKQVAPYQGPPPAPCVAWHCHPVGPPVRISCGLCSPVTRGIYGMAKPQRTPRTASVYFVPVLPFTFHLAPVAAGQVVVDRSDDAEAPVTPITAVATIAAHAIST